MNNGKFWNNQNIPTFDHNETQQGLISNFYKFGKRLGQKCLRQYILIRQYLLYSDIGNCEHIKGSVRLDGVYASFQISNSEYQIYLKNNGLQIVLCTDDVNQYETWVKILSSRCILSTFNEDIILGNLIGNGSFSTVLLYINKVYEGRNKVGEVFAIKAIPKKQSKSLTIIKQYEEQLLSEISSLRELDHTNILKLHRVYETAEKLYLVTEFIQGYELISKATSKVVFQGYELISFIHQMLLAIKEMHEHNIMHRDIKPQNIILKNGQLSQPSIIDFGLAKKGLPFPSCGSLGQSHLNFDYNFFNDFIKIQNLDEKKQNYIFSLQNLVKLISYSAPEILRFDETKKQYNGQCDIFSFGITLFVIIYGYNPFKTQDQKQTVKRNADAYFEFPNSIYPQELEHLILLMTKKYPKDRITAAQALTHPIFEIKLYQTIQLPMAILTKYQYEMNKNFNNINVHASLEMDRDFGQNYAIRQCSSSPQNHNDFTLSNTPQKKLKQIDEFQLDCIEDSVDLTHLEKLRMGQRYFSKQKSKNKIQL